MKFDIGFQDGAVTGVRVAASAHHTNTLGEQQAALNRANSIDLVELETMNSAAFKAFGADIAAAQLSTIFHSEMIELANKTLKSGSIDDALNQALAIDSNLDGEIALEELVNSRFHNTKTVQDYMNELAKKYIDRAAELYERRALLPVSLHEELITKGYTPKADKLSDQSLHIMTMDQVIETVKRFDEMISSEMEVEKDQGIYSADINEHFKALQQDHLNGKFTAEQMLQEMDKLNKKINEYIQTNEYIEKQKEIEKQLGNLEAISVKILRA